MEKKIIGEGDVKTPTLTPEQENVFKSQGISAAELAAAVGAAVRETIASLGLDHKERSGKIEDPTEPVKPEDVLKEPVPFYAPAMAYVISSIMYGGVEEKLPHGIPVVKFKFEAARAKRGGKEHSIQVISNYMCTTKPMLEALRKDFRYNAAYYEGNGKKAFDVDTRITSKIISYLTSLTQKDQGAVFAEAHKLGLNTKKFGLQDLRMKIATYYAQQDLQAEMKESINRMLNIEKDALLLAGKATEAESLTAEPIKP